MKNSWMGLLPLLAKTQRQQLILLAQLLHVTSSSAIFKESHLRHWRLGIAGMTAMLSLGTLLWELDG